MKLAALAFLLFASSLHGQELELGFYYIFPDAGRRQAGVIFELEAKADRRMTCDDEGNFDLGLGTIADDLRTPIPFKFPQIRYFLEQERHKEMVVVSFEKLVMAGGDEAVAKKAAEVTQQMQGVGYKRVVILGMAGSGVHYIADTNLKAKAAE